MLKFGASTDPGRVRENNEDAYLALPEAGLFAVADGVGGQEAGEVASRLAVDYLAAEFVASREGARAVAVETLLRTSVVSAHQAIKAEGRRRGVDIATTLTAALLQGRQATIVHIGDSAAFLVDEQGARQLSTDHTVVAELVRERAMTPAEAETHPQRHVITKALGANDVLEPDVFTTTLPPGSTLVLCTDGLTDFVSEDGIARIVQNTKAPQEAADRLVAAANRAGGGDNITVVVVKIPGGKPRTSSRARGIVAALAFFVLLAGGATAGANWYLNNHFFIGEKDGRIAIFRGVPGTFARRPLFHLSHRTFLPITLVRPFYMQRLREGIPVASLAGIPESSLDTHKRIEQLIDGDPVGPRLAIVRDGKLFVVPIGHAGTIANGQAELLVCECGDVVSRLCWSGDGKMIAFSSDGWMSLVVIAENSKPIKLAERAEPVEFLRLMLVCDGLSAGNFFNLLTGETFTASWGNQTPPWRLVVRPLQPKGKADLPRRELWLASQSTGKLLKSVTEGIAGQFTSDDKHVVALRESAKTPKRYDLVLVEIGKNDSTVLARGIDGAFALYRPRGAAQ